MGQPEYTVIYMPLNSDGNGPVSPGETVYETWEVWEGFGDVIVACFTEDHANRVVAALNFLPLYQGSVAEFDT